MSLKNDDSGQFILLMGIIVAIGLVIILVFLNQSLMAGHSSAVSIMNFPKNDIRDFRAATLDEANSIGNDMNAKMKDSPGMYNNSSTMLPFNDTYNEKTIFNDTFNRKFGNYVAQLKDIFAIDGTIVDVTSQNDVEPILMNNNTTIYPGYNTTISLYYYNGETSYNDTTVLYFG